MVKQINHEQMDKVNLKKTMISVLLVPAAKSTDKRLAFICEYWVYTFDLLSFRAYFLSALHVNKASLLSFTFSLLNISTEARQ